MRGVSKRASGRASGPVLTSQFSAVVNHRARDHGQPEETFGHGTIITNDAAQPELAHLFSTLLS